MVLAKVDAEPFLRMFKLGDLTATFQDRVLAMLVLYSLI